MMRLPSLFLVNGVASVTMMLLNKTIANSFSFPIATVALQNIIALLGTLILVSVDPSLVGPVRLDHIMKTVPGTILFACALVFAMMSARLMSVPIASMCSNLRPLATGLTEIFLYRGYSLSRRRIFGLLMVALGSLVTAKGVDDIELQGMKIAIIYVVLTSFQSVLDNRTMKSVKSKQTALGINLYRLVLATPPLLIASFILEGERAFLELDYRSAGLILSSGVACLCAGVLVFRLQAVSSATSIQTANIAFKIVASAISISLHNQIPGESAWIGYFVSMVGVLTYTLSCLK